MKSRLHIGICLIIPLILLGLASIKSFGALNNPPPEHSIDLDVDSDNDNKWDLPEEDDEEERIEMDDPGKLIILNDDDDDNNKIPDKEDEKVNGPADREDFAVLVLKHPNNGETVTLRVDDENLVRIFTYDEQKVVIGPKVGNSYTATNMPRELLLVEGLQARTVRLDLICSEGKSDSVLVTPVKVDVSLAGLDETNEDKVGGFVQYHYDFPEYTNWHSGLTMESGYQFLPAHVSVMPNTLPSGYDTVILSYEGEEFYTNAVFVLQDGFYVPAKTNYPIRELPTFYIHAHAMDGFRNFRAVHAKSGATDFVKVTNVDVDLDIDSDHSEAFGGPHKDAFEDWIEDGTHADETNKPLKFVVFNDYYNAEMEGMPGYADIAMDTPTGPVAQNLLIPVEFKYPVTLENIPPENIKVKFDYSAWDPTEIEFTTLANGEKQWGVSGSMRLWMSKTGRNSKKITEDSSGDFIPPGVEMEISKLRGVTTFYLEGVNPSTTIGKDSITANIKIIYGTTDAKMEDDLMCTVIRAALDVDTFNDSGINEDPHEPGQGEDHYEDFTDRPGKIISINNRDKDGDGILDYLDGFDLDSENEQDDVNANEVFIPMVFTLPADIDYSNTTIRVTYDADDPKSAEAASTGASVNRIRIWTKLGSEARNKENVSKTFDDGNGDGDTTGDGDTSSGTTGGDYLAPDTYEARALGFTNGVNQVVFYVEAVKLSEKLGDIRVLFEAKLDERYTGDTFLAADAVRFTCVDSFIDITDYFSPRQAESPPYHVCKVDFRFTDYLTGMSDKMELQIKRSQDSWDNLFFKTEFSADSTVTDTKLYKPASGTSVEVYNVDSLYNDVQTMRVCWDGRKDADGDGTIDASNGVNIWADRPEHTGAGPVSFNARIVLRSEEGDIVHIGPVATTRTCPLQLDSSSMPLGGGAPYFGFYRDQVNSKYRSIMLDSPSVITKSDGRPSVSFIPYFNGNSWDHTPMKFGWTHNYEIRMQPVYVGGTRKLYFMNEGGHLLGPVDSNGKLWIFGEQATVTEQGSDSDGEPVSITLTTLGGTKYSFNGFGQIVTIEDRNGHKVNVTLNSFGSSNLMIQRVTGVNGPGPELAFTYDPQEENTKLQSVTIGDRTLTFGYHDVTTDVYGSPYDADEVLKTISGLEYVNEFTMGQGRRENRASRIITGSMSKRKVENVEHNFEYESEEDLTTPVAEAKVNKYDIGGDWRKTAITDAAATYDNGQSVAHAYSGNKLKTVTLTGNGGNATYNYEYNDKGQRIKASTAAGDSSMAYDEKGNLTDITSPDMAAVKLVYGVFGQISKRTLIGVGGTREFVYELDAKGNVTETKEVGDGTDPDPRSWIFNRDPSDASIVLSVTDPSGTDSSYAYDANELGLVQTITRESIKLVDRTYDMYGNLTSDKDPMGIGTASILYDKLDRTKTVTHTAGSGSVVSYTYTALDQIATTKVPPAGRSSQGLTTSYSFSAAGKPIGRAEKGTGVNRTYSYSDVDDEGIVKTMTVTEGGESITSTFAYDYAGRAVSESWAGVQTSRWARVYDLTGNVTESKDGEGNTTAMTYYSDNSLHVMTRPEGRGSVTRTIDGFGNLTSVTDISGGQLWSTPTAITAYEYDAFNRAKQMTDPAGKVWKYTYDLLDNLKTVETPKGHIYTYNYDAKSHLDSYVLPGNKTYGVTAAADGRIQGVTVPKGVSYSTPVDNYNNPLALKSPEGVGDYGSSQNNPYGMPFESLRGGFKTVQDRDDANRVISDAPPYAKGSKKRTVSYGLYGPRTLTMMDEKTVTRDAVTDNPFARKVKVGTSRVIETLSDGNGNNVSTTLKTTLSSETADKTVTTEYGCLGLPSRVTKGDERTTYWWEGRGNLQAIFAPSMATFMHYDACDRLISKYVNNRKTEYGYDDNGNCEKIDPPGPVEVNFEYDERDQLEKRIIKIDGNIYRAEVITRDDNGAITARTIKGANNTVVCSESFGRDDNDRLTSFGTRTAEANALLSYSSDSQMTREEWAGVWTDTVDPVSGLVISKAASPAFTFDRDDEGRVTSVTRDGSTAYTYTYDDSGLLAKETDLTSTLGGAAEITHQNDAYGHSMVRTLPAGANLTETLTSDGLVDTSAFTFENQSRSVSFTYNQSGRRLISMDLPGQVPTVGFSYNTRSELTGVQAGSICSVTLARDADTGRVLSKTLGHLGVTDTYTYHDMGRLIGESRTNGSYEAAYGYDEAGKRILRDISSGDFVHFTPPAASPAGTIYRVGQGFYPTISNALAAVIEDRGTAEFTSPAVIQLEPGTHAGPQVFQAPSLHPTATNQLIIQSRPGTTATLSGQVSVRSPTNILWRSLVIGGTLNHYSVSDASVSSCIVTGKLFFFYCSRASVVGNTFKAPTAAAPLSMMFSMAVLVRDNIFLVDSNNGAAIEELQASSADSDYNIYWPSNSLSRVEVHGIYTNPGLDAVTFEILSTNSPAFQSGLALTGFGTDFTGALRHPEKPCRGAVELLVDDGSITAGDIRDKGGRLIRRKVQGRVQNLGYDGRNRLTRWDWDGSAGTSCTYDYDHAGRRILTRETLAGTTTVTRYVYDGADVCAEYEDSDDDGDVDRTRVYWLLPGMDRRIGFAETVNNTTTFYYYLTDQVGTVLQIVKEDGTVVNQYDYDAFGRVRSSSETVENRYLFQGREWDKNGGFYYFRNRIYLPERGEFASPDMNLGRGILGELDGMATLTFCGGDPVNMMDPTGLDALHNTSVNETFTASISIATPPPSPPPKRLPPRNDLAFRAASPVRAEPPRHFLRAARNDAAAFTYQQATCGQYPLGSPVAEVAAKAPYQIIATAVCPSTALIYSMPDVATITDSNSTAQDKTVAGLKLGVNLGLYVFGKYLNRNAAQKTLASENNPEVKLPESLKRSVNAGTSYSRVITRSHYDAWKAGKAPIGGQETWITYTDDLAGISSSSGVAQRLTLLDDAGNLRMNDYVRIDFLLDDVFSSSLRSPIETVPARGYGFQHGGFTQGGARDLLMNPDAPITILKEVSFSPWR